MVHLPIVCGPPHVFNCNCIGNPFDRMQCFTASASASSAWGCASSVHVYHYTRLPLNCRGHVSRQDTFGGLRFIPREVNGGSTPAHLQQRRMLALIRRTRLRPRHNRFQSAVRMQTIGDQTFVNPRDTRLAFADIIVRGRSIDTKPKEFLSNVALLVQ